MRRHERRIIRPQRVALRRSRRKMEKQTERRNRLFAFLGSRRNPRDTDGLWDIVVFVVIACRDVANVFDEAKVVYFSSFFGSEAVSPLCRIFVESTAESKHVYTEASEDGRGRSASYCESEIQFPSDRGRTNKETRGGGAASRPFERERNGRPLASAVRKSWHFYVAEPSTCLRRGSKYAQETELRKRSSNKSARHARFISPVRPGNRALSEIVRSRVIL